MSDSLTCVIKKSTLTNIADSIRNKYPSDSEVHSKSMTANKMADLIKGIPVANLEEGKAVVNNTVLLPDTGYDGFSKVSIEIPEDDVSKTFSSGPTIYNGKASFTMYPKATGRMMSTARAIMFTKEDQEITKNGEISLNTAYFNTKVIVSVQPTLQEKTILSNGVFTPDEGYDGFSSVTVNSPGSLYSVTGSGSFEKTLTVGASILDQYY